MGKHCTYGKQPAQQYGIAISIIGAAQTRTNIKLSAIIFIPRNDLLRNTARIGFHIRVTT
jgi:hypothetical protein